MGSEIEGFTEGTKVFAGLCAGDTERVFAHVVGLTKVVNEVVHITKVLLSVDALGTERARVVLVLTVVVERIRVVKVRVAKLAEWMSLASFQMIVVFSLVVELLLRQVVLLVLQADGAVVESMGILEVSTKLREVLEGLDGAFGALFGEEVTATIFDDFVIKVDATVLHAHHAGRIKVGKVPLFFVGEDHGIKVRLAEDALGLLQHLAHLEGARRADVTVVAGADRDVVHGLNAGETVHLRL